MNKINVLAADTMLGTYDSAKEAALALHNNKELMAYAKELKIEFWAVIDKESHRIKEVSTGFHNGLAIGIYEGTFNDGDSVWHSHPSGSMVHGGDFNSAWGAEAHSIFASGTELSVMRAGAAGIGGKFSNYDEYARYSGVITYNLEVYRGSRWVSGRTTVYKY
ncbi:hypothetical protein [Microbulbifer rhizosphaerae]|uniref:Uncharacterized protein n=1 Tax=Microbulbifer rhizosphaerae TaxID=1562603 RepID=A0A7W4WDV8_9GAMM|nr:hypothetical protein [Microbulbifer rhizosphaerae]MBB3062434.1 hypothetical protein [Microbulbifer rhizosphaerae]